MNNARPVLFAAAAIFVLSPSARASLPEVDAFASSPATRRALARPAGDDVRPGTAVQVDARLGVPVFLWPARAGEAGRRVLAAKGPDPVEAARAHLLDLAPLWGLRAGDVTGAVVRHVHDTGRGAVIVQFRQEAFGVPVFRDEIRVAMSRSLEPIAIAGYLPGVEGLEAPVFALGAAEALARAAADFGSPAPTAADVRSLGPAPGGYERLGLARGGLLASPARAKKVLFHLPGRLVPAWYLEIDAANSGRGSELYACVLSAADGMLLYRHRLVADAFTYRVWVDASGLKAPLNGPQGRAGDPYPGTTPDRWQAPFAPPSLVTLSSGPISTRDPWLPDGATETSGNNVEAYVDLSSPDGFSAGDFHADVTSAGIFDRTYDVTKPPDASADQQKAAITQLFYTTNFLHDWYYDVGFDEVAGNAQASNYGRGGVEGDALRAEAQDFAGTDNANMSTPADGGRPRMQMFVWDLGAARTVAITAPAVSAATFAAGVAAFGPQVFSLSAAAAVAADGTGTATDACEPLTNGAAMSGKIALVDRGTCTFVVKIANAQAAGAAGIVIVNNQGDGLLTMADTPGATSLPYTIPALFVGQTDGGVLKSLVSSGLALRLTHERNRDGTLDDQIVAHEWAHYLSNRLIADANGLSANQSQGLGEGWSDLSALLLTAQAGDAAVPGNAGFGGIYPIAGYALGGWEGTQPNQAWYFGIRRYPYSTDLTKNPLTYADIMNGVALPAGAPVNVELFGTSVADGSNNAEVHNTGEVWATMLWECYAALLRDTGRLTFQSARDRMRAYFVTSLKLTPPNPTLLAARDAFLAAAWANDPADHALFVRAFAKRGAGPRAAEGDPFDPDNAGSVESFDVGGDIDVVSATLDDAVAPCDRDGRLDAGETGNLTVWLANRGLSRLTATSLTVATDNPAVTFPSGATLHVPATDPTQSQTVSLPVHLAAGTTGIQTLGFTLTLKDAGMFADATSTLTARGNVDDAPRSSASDDMEASPTVWKSLSDAGLDPSASFQRIEVTPLDHRWRSRADSDTAGLSLVSPPLVFGSGPVTLTFLTRFSFLAGSFFTTGIDYVDGGIVEFSTDGGATWSQNNTAILPGYGGPLYDGTGAASPLKGQKAWVGQSPDWPGFTTVSVAFDSTWAGKTVLLRFRRGMEGTLASNLWEIDDVAFTGLTNTPFPSLVADRGRCRGLNAPAPPAGPTAVKRR